MRGVEKHGSKMLNKSKKNYRADKILSRKRLDQPKKQGAKGARKFEQKVIIDKTL